MIPTFNGFLYDPQQSFYIPLTLLPHSNQLYLTQSLKQPFIYEVFCPISCKRIKIGCGKSSSSLETIQFNTTTCRTVNVYVNENIKYLVNGHSPNKKSKKKIQNHGWGIAIQAQQKGNIVIINPYCVDLFNPISLYTLNKLGRTNLGDSIPFNFIDFPKSKSIKIGSQIVYLSDNQSNISHNPYFTENSLEQMTVRHPENSSLGIIMNSKKLKNLIDQHLEFWLWQLKKTIDLEQGKLQLNEIIQYNIDVIYSNLNILLNIDEQIRARLMNNLSKNLYVQLYQNHPRLYTALSRFSSFLNYGNTHYSTIQLAEFGFYNKTDMLQNLSFYEFPNIPIPTAEEHQLSVQQLRSKLFPFSRLVHNLSFPNVPLRCSIQSMHYQTISEHKIRKYQISDHYLIFIDNQCNLSVWTAQLLLIKLFQFNYKKNYSQLNQKPIIDQIAKQKQQEKFIGNSDNLEELFNQEVSSKKLPQIPVQELKPDQTMLQQLINMGYVSSVAKKALLKTKNESIPVAIDAIEQINNQEIKKLKKKKPTIKKDWSCPVCTLFNKSTNLSCQACGQVPDLVDEQQLSKIKELEKVQDQQRVKKQEQERLKKQEEEKKKQQEKMKLQALKRQKQKQEQFIGHCNIADVKLIINQSYGLNPYIILILLVDKQQNKTILRLFRVGINRNNLVKFYRVEDNHVISNLTRKIYPKDKLQSFNALTKDSRCQIQWGIKLFQPSNDNDFDVIETVNLNFDGLYQKLQVNGYYIKLVHQEDKKQLKMKIIIQDTLQKSKTQIKQQNQFPIKIERQKQLIKKQIKLNNQNIIIKPGQQIILQQGSSQILIEILQHLPKGQFKPLKIHQQNIYIDKKLESNNVIMSDFIPLAIQHYQGAVYSWKHYSTSIFQKNSSFISNYPKINFTFRALSGSPMLVESITIISHKKKLQNIFPVISGLIFTADEISWFYVAQQRFKNVNKQSYQKWLKTKQYPNSPRHYWEPVGFFQIDSQGQIEIQYKRTAKYLFLLPISQSKGQNSTIIESYKIDFFGAKGRVQINNYTNNEYISNFKNEGESPCSIEIYSKNNNQQWIEIDQKSLMVSKACSPNNYFFLPIEKNILNEIPLSVTTIYDIKIRACNKSNKVIVRSKNAERIRLTYLNNGYVNEQNRQFHSFKQLVRMQKKYSDFFLQKIINNLNLKELILLLLQSNQDITLYQNLLKKLLEMNTFRQKIFLEMSNILPLLCEDEQQVSEIGLKSFLRFYQKICSIDYHKTFMAIGYAWKQSTQYVGKRRNKNYTILRNKYSIEELVLQPYLFSLDYYRLIHPNFIQQQKPTLSTQPQSPLNNCLFVNNQSKWVYTAYVDLLETKDITKIDLYFPKIPVASSKCKLQIRVMVIDQKENEQQIYYRYFNEEFLIQMGAYAFKDTFMYQKSHTNCLSIHCVKKSVRFLKMQVRYLLLTTYPLNRYKQISDNTIIIPLIESTKSSEQLIDVDRPIFLKDYPMEVKHNLTYQKMPPSRYILENNKYYYRVHQFQKKISQKVKSQYSQLIDKITTNIMDQKIVEECIRSINVAQYQFGRKGIDFAYLLVINLIQFFKKISQQFTVSVQLMLNLFDTFVVYENGPIMKQILSLLSELYRRLGNQQRCIFIDSIINKYLTDAQKINSLKISQQYSISKIIQTLRTFQLPTGFLMSKLQQSKVRLLTSALLTILIWDIQNHKITHYQIYQIRTSKYRRNMQLQQMMNISFKACLWILDNFSRYKQQTLIQGLNLLLKFLPIQKQQPYVNLQATKKFIKSLQEQQLWKLVFLTLKLKNQHLNTKIHQIFKCFIENITQNFQKSINSMLVEIIKKSAGSLYLQINLEVSDDIWMNHLQTILEYLSLTNSKMYLDVDTALCLLELPLTTSLWSLALHIIPRKEIILKAIIKNFPEQYYTALGKEITSFCQPLAGIPHLGTIHVNWLHLVRKIRLEGMNLFQLFIQELQKCSFGGKQGLVMALGDDVKQLEITLQFLKLVLKQPLKRQQLTKQNINILFSWYYLNKIKEKGLSPATQNLRILSQQIVLLFEKMTQIPQILPYYISEILRIKKQSQNIEGMFREKRIASFMALKLNQKFCNCFKQLLGIFMLSDDLASYFAFDLGGVEYVLGKLGLQQQTIVTQENPDNEYILLEKFIPKIYDQSQSNQQKIKKQVKVLQISPQEIKQEEFGANLKLVDKVNPHGIAIATKDWTTNKKGTGKAKILTLPMTEETSQQYPLQIELSKTAQIRSIKIGFLAYANQNNDKLTIAPSSITVEGGIDLNHYQPLGEMNLIDDDGYQTNGIKVFVLNLQKMKRVSNISESLKNLQYHRIKYIKLTIKRPVIAFIEGNYSQLNNRNYNSICCGVTFLSIIGDDCQKLPSQMVDSCKQLSRQTGLTILNLITSDSNPRTSRSIANCQKIVSKFRYYFPKVKQYIKNYPNIVPQIMYALGAGNPLFGDWIINQFLSEGSGDIQAKLVNQIIISTPQKIYDRINIFLKNILQKISTIDRQSQIQSGLLFARDVHFIQSFCKTLQQCYNLGTGTGSILDIQNRNIDQIISVYDKKYSSPEIKSIQRLLVSLLYIKHPLELSQDIRNKTLNKVWNNCSQAKPYFYILNAALLVHRKSINWIRSDNRQKIVSLLEQIHKSIQANNIKILKLQIFLLTQISYHQGQYLFQKDVHLSLYNQLKMLIYQDSDIFEYLTKIIHNTAIGNPNEEKRISQQLVKDVVLLVKRRDPILQKFYVGLLAMESQVMVTLTGLQNNQEKVQVPKIPTRLLNRNQQKFLLDSINKKYKFSLIAQAENKVKTTDYQHFLHCFSNPSFLLVIRLKKDNNISYCGLFNSSRSVRSEEDSYIWQETINYQKGNFLFYIHENECKIIENDPGITMGSIFGGEQQNQELVVFYDKNTQVIKLSFNQNSTCLFTIIKQFNGYVFDAYQLWDAKPFVSNNTQTSKALTLSTKVKPPFNFYRHSNIYVFPGRIQIKKLLEMLGAKDPSISQCRVQGKILEKDIQLKQLQKRSQDFIIDLELIDVEINANSQYGYIPQMSIFDKYLELGGINQVLNIGSQSIKQWKNPQTKKNFQNYMQQLKSFIYVPNFFSLFVKNQTSVTFLFEVAAGLPDDPNTTRNWQQQQMASSRFIYKNLSDIFKFDRSTKLRNMDNYSDLCQAILDKIAQISKETVRQLKEQNQQNNAIQAPTQLAKIKSQPKRKKKKGTGYGADSQNNSKWSSTQWLQNRKLVCSQILNISSIFVSFLECQEPLKDERLSSIIKQSCLLPLLESALRSGSLLDISKQSQLFKCYLAIIRNLANNPATVSCLVEIQKKYKPQQTQSIHKLLIKLNNIAQVFSQCLKSGKVGIQTNQVAQLISTDIQKTFAMIDKAVKNMKKQSKAITIKQINQLPVDKAYRLLLGDLRFGYVNLLQGGSYKHAYSSSITGNTHNQAKILRLSQQLADMSSSLPCQHTNSIFVRCDRSRIDVIKVLIMGSKDTPYSNGAFMFDVFCDDSYPSNPPKMVITTTGQGKIRFNPNLYSCGKGMATQNWDAKLSTLLQLFISTQGITMSQDVYFNQPGFEGQQGTEEGQKKNQAYSNIVRLGNVRHAMNDQLKNPPKGFEDIINRHFYCKKKQILQQLNKWLEYADKRQASYNGLVHDHNSSWSSQLKAYKGKYKELLLKEVQQLKQLLNKIPQPNLKEKQQQFKFQSNRVKRQSKIKEIKFNQIDVSYDLKPQKQLEIQENVIQDRWSRYIGAMGVQAVKKQSESKVLLIGLKSLGLEIAKNLVLSGLKKLSIIDNDKIIGHQEHFYLSNMKGKLINQCIFKIKQLNPYMIVEKLQEIPDVKDYNFVVSTQSIAQAIPISIQCRKNKVGFVHTQTCGVSGTYFADFGPQFIINDTNGQQPFQGLIKNITIAEEGIVTLLDGIKHPYEDGDYIVINKVQGMKQIQSIIQQKSEAQIFYENTAKQKPDGINGRVFKIKVINWNSFCIGDTRNFESYIQSGLCKNIKLPKKIQFKSFEECLIKFQQNLDPNLGMYDFEKISDNYSIFICYQAYSIFKKTYKRAPRNWSLEDAKLFEGIISNLCQQAKKTEEDIKKICQFATLFSFICEAQLPTIGAYLGGLVSQEIIKGITNKFSPIKQFFTFHLNEMVGEIPQNQQKLKQKQIGQEQPFRNLKIVIGKQNSQKIQKMNAFVIGAGAIGCEILKNFAMINMSAKGNITVTDPDHIQTSNLTRQFLFRQKHVKKPKSATASATLIQMNPFLEGHISARLDKVCQATQETYSDDFFQKQTVVANALDNVKARQYVDKRCVKNKRPLFQSGTLGPKGHVQVIVPEKTENYGSQNDPAQQNQIPHCTLKMFPQQTVHCIEWSRDIFGKKFTLNPKALKKLIDTKDVNSIEGEEKETVKQLIEKRPLNFDDCVTSAVHSFYRYFRNNVRQLIHTYPLDMKTKQGKLFWQLPKRPPKQINELDFNDEMHSIYITSYAVLEAKIFSIPFPKDFRKPQGRQKIMNIAKLVKVADFVPSEQESKKLKEQQQQQEKSKIKKIMSEQENSIGTQSLQIQQKIQQKSQQLKLELTSQILQLQIQPQEFQKDQDSNGHIDLIYSMSNLRSRNYGLAQCQWIQAKLKAGRIMPALSTTTSVVAALQTIEIIKLVVGCKNWRNAFVNLAVPFIQISQPGEPTKNKIGNTNFTVWDEWEFKVNNLGELINQIKTKYDVEAYNISTSDGKPIYWEAMYKDKQEAKNKILNKALKQMFPDQQIQLNIAMRNWQTHVPFENVPRINVIIV